MITKKRLLWAVVAFVPIVVFALSEKAHMKNVPHGELYVSDAVINKILYTQKHFEYEYKPRENSSSIFEEKKQNNELHFEYLDFTKPVEDDAIGIQILPLYKRSDVDDYKNTQTLCPFCINLVSFKIPFF